MGMLREAAVVRRVTLASPASPFRLNGALLALFVTAPPSIGRGAAACVCRTPQRTQLLLSLPRPYSVFPLRRRGWSALRTVVRPHGFLAEKGIPIATRMPQSRFFGWSVLRRTSSSEGGATAPESGKPTTTTVRGKLSAMWKQYGLVSVAVYTAISMVDLVLFFWAISIGGAGILKPIENFAQKYLPDLSHIFGKAGKVPELSKEIEEAQKDNTPSNVDDAVEDGKYRIQSHSLWTSFVLAYGFHKLFLPIRVPISAMITPPVARMLQRWGWRVSGWKIYRVPPSGKI